MTSPPLIHFSAENKAVGVMKVGQTFTIEPMINAGEKSTGLSIKKYVIHKHLCYLLVILKDCVDWRS